MDTWFDATPRTAEFKVSKMTVQCPRCGQNCLFSPENPFKPFCSERCQIIDLGAWADESYRVPVQGSDPDESENAEIPGDGESED
jgi:endogenous inhibitor of DNA gyrase (YacG/DUF329 family)